MSDVPEYKLGFGRVRGIDAVVVARNDGGWSMMDRRGPLGEAPPADLLGAVRDWDVWAPRFDAVSADEWPATAVTPDEVTWHVPLIGDKLVCIGANYDDHIGEMDVPRPPWPYSFVVPPTTTIVLSGQDVSIPRGVHQWDWEAELAVVIGRRTRYVSAEQALSAIAAYLPLNDLSARDSGQTRIAFGIDMVMIKAHDDSKVVGPLITPARFVPDPQNIRLGCTVNGVVKQDMDTSTMIFTVAECIAHLSTIMTLEAGDIIATGTGGGVGILRDPPEVLRDGDSVSVTVDGIGATTTVMRKSTQAAALDRAAAPTPSSSRREPHETPLGYARLQGERVRR